MVAIVHVPCPLQWRHDPHHWWWWWGTGFIKRPAMAAMEILTVHQVWRHGPRTDEVRLYDRGHMGLYGMSRGAVSWSHFGVRGGSQ